MTAGNLVSYVPRRLFILIGSTGINREDLRYSNAVASRVLCYRSLANTISISHVQFPSLTWVKSPNHIITQLTIRSVAGKPYRASGYRTACLADLHCLTNPT